MDDLDQLFDLTESYPRQLEQLTEEWLVKLREILWGHSVLTAAAKDVKDIPAASPQQTKKRPKRLPSLNEDAEGEESSIATVGRKSKRSNAELLAMAETIKNCDPVIIEEPELRTSDSKSTNKDAELPAERKSEASNLMPPPPAPVVAVTSAVVEEAPSGRPQRAAKLKCEKNLAEPKCNTKLRRPTNDDVNVKLEHEQRPSQMHEAAVPPAPAELSPKSSLSSSKSNDSVLVIPGKNQTTVVVSGNSDDELDPLEGISNLKSIQSEKEQTETNRESSDGGVRPLRIKIKREKASLPSQEDNAEISQTIETTLKASNNVPPPMTAPKSESTTIEESSITSSSVLSETAATVKGKKARKKKEAPRPIKVERFSDLDHKTSPVASRTRQGSTGASRMSCTENDAGKMAPDSEEQPKRGASVYEDAVETPPSRNSKAEKVNETVNIGPSQAVDATINLGPVSENATFCTNAAAAIQTTFVVDGNPNATVTLNKPTGSVGMCDATFEVHASKGDKDDDTAGQRSFETAKDSSLPHDDSMITEDESIERPPPTKIKPTIPAKASGSASSKISGSAKAAYKMPSRTNELFNPLAQSPVKMRVEAFENAAAAAAEQPKRPLRNKKENVTPSSVKTPVIGKLPAPALGRFLTPTQTSNLTSVNSAVAKKGTTSASKAMPMPKSGSSTLQRSGSTASSKTLQRENSADDFRKGLHNLAEERKKQREQKHMQAAQLREAKERERAERMAKLAKEREEKRLQKQQEQEQKRRDLEEIQRKLRLQQEEEAARAKAIKEREMLLQMKQQQQMATKQRMLPPPPKTLAKYTFEMLHEDDSTDDEDKVSYKRPPAPSWSRSHKRGPYVLKQEYIPSCYIDSFFSVQPMTPDLKQIFPNIDIRQLKRNSSVLWSTPPRYSELPKY